MYISVCKNSHIHSHMHTKHAGTSRGLCTAYVHKIVVHTCDTHLACRYTHGRTHTWHADTHMGAHTPVFDRSHVESTVGRHHHGTLTRRHRGSVVGKPRAVTASAVAVRRALVRRVQIVAADGVRVCLRSTGAGRLRRSVRQRCLGEQHRF